MRFGRVPIHVIDFEGNRECGIVEFGVVTLLNGEISEARTRLCRAQGKIRPEEAKLHGIRGRDTLVFEPFSMEWEYFKTLRQNGPFAAHYASIENRLIKQVWPYPPYSPDFLSKDQMVADWGLWVDTCVLYCKLFPQLESHKLMDLIEVFELDSELDRIAILYCPKKRAKFHCALYDALASMLLIRHISGLPGFENITVQWLLKNSSPRGARASQGELF